jgi:hypothetical protein
MVEEWLRPAGVVSLIRMIASWQERYQIDDSEPSYSNGYRPYDSTACNLCRQVMNNGSFTVREGRWEIHRANFGTKTVAVKVEELYDKDTMDKVSEACYQMPPVTETNIDSL